MQSYHIAVTVIRGDNSAPIRTHRVVKVSAVDGYGVAVEGLPGGRRYFTGNRVNVPTVAYGDVLNVTGTASRPVQLLVKSAPYIAPHGTTGPLRSMDGFTLAFSESGAYTLTRIVGTTTVLMWRSAPMLQPSSPVAVEALETGIRRYEAAILEAA